MSGIAGLIDRKYRHTADAIAAMSQRHAHCGLDEVGTFLDGETVGLALWARHLRAPW